MLEIESLIGSLKKNRVTIEEISSTTLKEMKILLTDNDRLLEFMVNLQEQWTEKQSTQEALDQEIDVLDGEIAGTEQEKNSLETTSKEQETTAKQTKDHLTELEKTLEEAEKKLEHLQDELRTTESAIKDSEVSSSQSQDQLEKMSQEQETAIDKIRVEIGTFEGQAAALESKYKALRFLLKEELISMPEAKVAEHLKGLETTTLDHLQKATLLTRLSVIEVLEQLAKRQVIEFKRDTEKVKVLKPIDL